jgi:hypothetical protein
MAAYGALIGPGFVAAITNVAGIAGPVVTTLWVVAASGTLGWCFARSPDSRSIPQTIVKLLIAPLVLLVMLEVFALAFALIIAPLLLISPVLWVTHLARERRRRSVLAAQGRWVTADVLRPKLDAGMGTLIVESGVKMEPHRIWWTRDGLFSIGNPVSTNDEFRMALVGEHAFNTQCLRTYLDEKTGSALLTSLRPRYALGGKLARMLPRMKVAKVIRP